MTDLYLIRHGEALGAIHNIIGDTALSPGKLFQPRQWKALNSRWYRWKTSNPFGFLEIWAE